MKTCNKCKEEKELTEYANCTNKIDGKRSVCKKCRNAQRTDRNGSSGKREVYNQSQKEYRHKYPVRFMVYDAKRRSEKQGLPFDITEKDLPLPDVCPVLGIPFKIGTGCINEGSPTLDKFVPALGYVKGNVNIISHKANTMKLTATAEEVLKLYNWMKKQEEN